LGSQNFSGCVGGAHALVISRASGSLPGALPLDHVIHVAATTDTDVLGLKHRHPFRKHDLNAGIEGSHVSGPKPADPFPKFGKS